MKENSIVKYLQLQGAVIVYSLSTVAANCASKYDFLSLGWIGFFALDFLALAIYALIWQQVIKKFQLSVAYANKAITLMWSMLWNFIIFSNGITPKNVIAVLIVVAGVIVMNSSDKEGKEIE